MASDSIQQMRLTDGGTGPLVSVIIAAYCQPRLLNAALCSVCEQTYRPIEVIVVDDASGPEMIGQYQLPADALLIVQPHRFAMAAVSRNTALKAAQGKYVALLDQDDLWVPQKIAWQVQTLEAADEAVLTYGDCRLVEQDLAEQCKQHAWRSLGDDPAASFVMANRISSPSQVLLRRSTLDRIGGFDESIRGASDWDMWLRCSTAGKVVSDPRVMALYRQHPQQWSRNRAMIHAAQVQVLRKAGGWLLRERPDLRWRWRRSLSRALRNAALAGCQSHEGRPMAWRQLWSAMGAWPADCRNYMALFRVWQRSRGAL